MSHPRRDDSWIHAWRTSNLKATCTATGDEVIYQHDQRYDQQQMDQAARYVEDNESYQPQYHQNDYDSPKDTP